jgi:uridine phosphorylase
MGNEIGSSELILNEDGSVYHLHLLPEHLAENIIIVGDQDRVKEVSKHFDKLEFTTHKREFVTHTGYVGNKKLSVVSTGIGTDNIDIVFNELDALVNIDLHTRQAKSALTRLKIVRVGTSGTLQKDIAVDSLVLSSFGLGIDGLMSFYKDKRTAEEESILQEVLQQVALPIVPSLSSADEHLLKHFRTLGVFEGITLTATGFYGPQGRKLRLEPKLANFIDSLAALNIQGHRITNLEMETAGIYGLGNLLGHQCLSVNAILANRQTKEFSKDPHTSVEKAILFTLEKMLSL